MDLKEDRAAFDLGDKDLLQGLYWRPLLVRYVFPLLGILIFGILWFGGYLDRLTSTTSEVGEPTQCRCAVRYKGSFKRDFNDLNDLQLEAARAIGIAPLESREGLDAVSGRLREVKSNGYVQLDPLTHSIPYLVPRAVSLLDEIGRKFVETLKKEGLPLYQPIVTSVTRTRSDIKRLQHGNVNATDHSTHLYATTFDISWKRYYKVDSSDPRCLSPEQLKHVLAVVLADLRDGGRCYVKHEVKQACFHITTRP